MPNKVEQIATLTKEIITLDSYLAKERIQNGTLPVVGEGSLDASIIFIGEAPGEKESLSGKPFIGRAGKLLNELLDSISLKREGVYITNIIKDRPPKNRDPKPEEISEYAPFLDRQIEIIQPSIIATLGRFSMEYIMNRYGLMDQIKTIGELHGKSFTTSLPWGKVIIVPLYHPAAAIYNQRLKETLVSDFKVLKTLI